MHVVSNFKFALAAFALLGLSCVCHSSAQAGRYQNTLKRIPFRPVRVASAKAGLQQESQVRRLNQYPSSSSTARPNINTPPAGGVALPQTAKFQVQEPAGGSRSKRAGKKIEIDFGTMQLIDDIKLPALEPGTISNLNVVEGQYIEANSVVGFVDSLLELEEKAQSQSYENARERALDEYSILAAKSELALRNEMFRKSQRLYQRRAVSETEHNQAKFEMELAGYKLEKAKSDQRAALGEAKLELARYDIVKKRLNRCKLISQYDAYVIKINKKVQEYVNVGEEVMQLGRMDVLWAQGTVEASDLNENDALNRPVTVTLELANNQVETFEGKVDYIPLERQGSDQYAVKVRIQNRRATANSDSWLLRPLARVRMTIHLDRGVINEAPRQPGRSPSASKSSVIPKVVSQK